jgi:hypothetical protein
MTRNLAAMYFRYPEEFESKRKELERSTLPYEAVKKRYILMFDIVELRRLPAPEPEQYQQVLYVFGM